MTPLDALLSRRSTSVRDLTAPGPSDAELEQILRIAARVPDHGKLCPWRIVALRGLGARKLGELAADIYLRNTPDTEAKHREQECARFLRAPLCLAVIATPVENAKVPDWEQYLSAAAVCMNILHAAHALGYGGKWLTEWVAYDTEILAALLGSFPNEMCTDSDAGLTPSALQGEPGRAASDASQPNPRPLLHPYSAREEGFIDASARIRIAGFIYLGTKATEPEERARPALEQVVSYPDFLTQGESS